MAEKNSHDGHRKRLKNKFIENGLDVFEPHEALELFLFYAIPRKDTNPLAHRLLDRYYTISSVCDAPIDELQKEFGMTENAAVLLKLLPEMARLYEDSRYKDDNLIELDTIGDQIAKKFIGRINEVVVVAMGDARGRLIYNDVVAKGSINSSDVPIRKIVDLALRHNAKSVFIAHNHPSGALLPSASDIRTTVRIKNTLSEIGVSLADHFIVADGEVLSIRENKLCTDAFPDYDF